MFKCLSCKYILKEEDLIDGLCPECNSVPKVMCENDPGFCDHTVVGGFTTCDKCGEFMCPECGNHDCVVISRVTGYLSPVGNGSWNSAKVQELHDRVRYDL